RPARARRLYAQGALRAFRTKRKLFQVDPRARAQEARCGGRHQREPGRTRSMREQPLNEQSLHPVLAELPVFAPDADLWSRIAAEHAKRSATPRPRRWIAVVAAAAA